MKKVVKSTQQVDVSLVSNEKFYGIQEKGLKGFISREKYDGGNYKACCAANLTNGNSWWINKSSDSLVDTINTILSNSNYQVFEFETSQELFLWLSQ